MPNITKQQALNRWDKLPMVLREAIFSERNADILWGVCETQHLSEDKIYKIATLAGNTIMGFIHLEDFEKEIKQELGLNPDIVVIIAQEINRKIFAPIRSEIDKAYVLPLESEKPEEETQAPEIEESIVTDIRRETGGVKITKEVRYAQPAEVEPMRIVGVGEEEKLIVPKAEEKGFEIEKPVLAPEPISTPVMPEGPVVLHEEEGLQTVLGETKKKSLGELFGFLNGKETAVRKESAPVIGEVGYGDKEESESLKKEPEERVVHYDVGLMTPLGEEEEIKKEPEKKESKPRLFFRNIIQAIKPTIKVVDFTEVEEEKKDISEPENLKEESLITETEAPKMIMEETKGIEEIKEEAIETTAIEKKPGFFSKLFKSKNKEEQIVVDLTQTNTDLIPEQIQKEEEIKIESIKEKKNLFSKLSGLFKKKE